MSKGFVLLINTTSESITEIRENLHENDIPTITSSTYKEGFDKMLTFNPSLVIVNCSIEELQQSHLYQLSEKLLKKLIPFIVITPKLSMESFNSLHTQGVFDRVEYPLNFTTFNHLVLNRLRFKEQVDSKLIHDDLPNVFNRKAFYDHVHQKFLLATKQQLSFSAALVNINHLKDLNSLVGIDEVDEYITQFVTLLVNTDNRISVYRFSGKEFLVLFEETSIVEATEQLGKTAAQFKAYGKSRTGLTKELTFSYGLVFWDSPDKSISSLLSELDLELNNNRSSITQEVLPQKEDFSTSSPQDLEIILLDDDPIILEILTHELTHISDERFTITLKSFIDGHEFIHSNWYNPSTHYVLILNGVMPKMSGFEVLQLVRSSYPSDKIIITMLTSRENSTDIDFSFQTGVDDYITKPFRPKEVSLRIQRLIRRLF